jgi:hypothetical protein
VPQSLANVLIHFIFSTKNREGFLSGKESVSASATESVIFYVQNQEEHHRRMTFQDEYRLFLKRYRIAFDERYVWD